MIYSSRVRVWNGTPGLRSRRCRVVFSCALYRKANVLLLSRFCRLLSCLGFRQSPSLKSAMVCQVSHNAISLVLSLLLSFSTYKDSCDYIGPPGQSKISSPSQGQLILNAVCYINFSLTYNVTYSQVPGHYGHFALFYLPQVLFWKHNLAIAAHVICMYNG